MLRMAWDEGNKAINSLIFNDDLYLIFGIKIQYRKSIVCMATMCTHGPWTIIIENLFLLTQINVLIADK